MALQLRTRSRARNTGGDGPERALTIEEARRVLRPGSLELAVAELKELERLGLIAKSHTNATNRQSTVAKNALKLLAREQEFEPEDQIQVGDVSYRYDYAYSEKVDVKKLYELFKQGKIKEDVFLSSIVVHKDNCKRYAGEHIVNQISETEAGKTLDIRTQKLDTPVKSPVIVRGKKQEPRAKLIDNTKVAPSAKITLKPIGSKLKRRKVLGRV